MKRDLSIVVINLPWTALATLEVFQEGKSSAKTAECIAADAGARSQGAMAGSALAAGLAAPAVSAVPYVGWLAGGWALLLGQNIGSEVGSQVGSVFNDC